MIEILKLIRTRGLVFIISIIASILAGYLILQYKTNQQRNEGLIINLAGRQRMLSQRIAKLALIIEKNKHEANQSKVDTLNSLAYQFQKASEKLITYNNQRNTQNKKIDSLFSAIDPYANILIFNVKKIAIAQNQSSDIDQSVAEILSVEIPFLKTMELIVREYQLIFEKGNKQFTVYLISLSGFIIIIIITQFFLIVIPAYRSIIKQTTDLKKANYKLAVSEDYLKNNVNHLNRLTDQLKLRGEMNKIFIEQSPSAIAMFDNEMKYMAASKQWINDYKLKERNIIGISHYEIFPEIGSDWKEIHQSCLKGAINKCDEAYFERADGTAQWLSWDVRPWYISKEKIGGLLMCTADITKLKEKDLEKLRIEEILEKTNEVARIGTWEIKTATQEILWSKVTKEIHEVAPDYIPKLDSAINFFKVGESRDKITAAVNEVMTNGTPYDIEVELITATGKTVWARAIGQAEFKNGKCVRVYGVFQDISKIKQHEDELKNERNLLEMVIDNVPINIYMKDLESRKTLVNRRELEYMNAAEEDVLGRSDFDLYPIESAEISRREDLEVLTSGKPMHNVETYNFKKDGASTWFISSKIPIKNMNGEITGLLGVSYDITQRKEAENALQLLSDKLSNQNRQLATFVHIVSHNLRSPVSNLNSLLGFYKSSETENDRKVLFDKFETVIYHLTTTLNSLVEAVKIKGETDRNIEEIDFESVLKKTLEILTGQIKETNAKITWDFSRAQKINYDINYLESIMLNLITNAIKYRSPDRQPEIKIESYIQENKIQLAISDNGLGIDLKRHGSKLFGLNKTFHRNEDAKGVGLYITKTQIEAMGGSISATSTVNEGTIFTVIF
jgi:PAS domain S-box-containing protein